MGLLEDISKKTGKPVEELQTELNKIYKEDSACIFPDVKELDEKQKEYIKVMAVNRLKAFYRKELSTKSELIENVIFIGASEGMDMISKKRKEAIECYNKNPQDAINKKIVKLEEGKIIPLFYSPPEEVEKMVGTTAFMKKRLGTPMPDTQLEKYAVGAIEANGQWKEIFFKVRGKNINVSIPTFSIVEFQGFKTKSQNDMIVKVNDAGSLNITIKRPLTEDEIKNLLTTALRAHNAKLADIPKYIGEHLGNGGKLAYGEYAIFKAVVTEIVPEQVTDTGRIIRMIRIEDDSVSFTDSEGNVIPPITCFMPPHIPINFPEGSIIYAIGQPTVKERGNSISILGVYVPIYCRNNVPPKKDIEDGKDIIPKPKQEKESVPDEATPAVEEDEDW